MFTEPNRLAAELECRVFCQYLTSTEPSDYVSGVYSESSELATEASAPSDIALLQVARHGPFFARAADAYASVFARRSTLRRRLILLTAILESVGATSDILDKADTKTGAQFITRFTLVLVQFVFLFFCGAALLGARMAIRPLRSSLGAGDE